MQAAESNGAGTSPLMKRRRQPEGEGVVPFLADRQDLALCYRLCARFGFNEGVCNHLSLQPDGHDRILLIAYGLHWSQATARDILVLDFDGRVVHGHGEPERTGLVSHLAFHRGFGRDAAVVLHTHMPFATTLMALQANAGGRLLPVHQNYLRFDGWVAYEDTYDGLFDEINSDRTARTALRFRDGHGGRCPRAMMSANHGVFAFGPTVAEAWDDLYYLERFCEVQVRALTCAGGDLSRLRLIPEQALKDGAAQAEADRPKAITEHWRAMKKLMSPTCAVDEPNESNLAAASLTTREPRKLNRDRLGWRAKVAVLVPSTNTVVQPDFDEIRHALKAKGIEGLTNHVGRISIPNMDISDNAGFAKLQALIPLEVDAAAERCMSAQCDHMAMGMSAPTFFGGRAACVEKRHRLSEKCGGVAISSGSFACEAALHAFGARRIAVLSPYAEVGDVEVTRFFTDCGFVVVRFKGLRCLTPIAIAEVTEDVLAGHMKALDGPDVDALVQVGTNLSMVRCCAHLETELGKPVLAINACTYWHAVRSLGIDAQIEGFGRIFKEL